MDWVSVKFLEDQARKINSTKILEDKTEEAYIKEKQFRKKQKREPKEEEFKLSNNYEGEASETSFMKRKERVSMFKKLKNNLTPHEIVYGPQENDSDYLNKLLD